MTKAELGTIISKIFSIFYFFQSVWVLLTYLPILFHSGHQYDPYIITSASANYISLLLLAISLWFGSEKLGKLIVGKDDTKTISSFSPDQFMAGVFVAFGCLLLSKIIPDLSELLAIVFSNETTSKFKTSSINITEKFISIGIYSILSVFFILGADGLQRGVFILRNFKTEK